MLVLAQLFIHTLGNIFFGECGLSELFDIGGVVYFGGTEWYHDPYYRAGVTVAAAASSRMQQNSVDIV
jgi:hypothetical protein